MSGWRESLKVVFRFDQLVDRKSYFLLGSILMAIKYLGEMALHWRFAGDWLSPIAYLNPMLTTRWPGPDQMPSGYLILVAIWTLPFVWAGFSLSSRRMIDANWSPWWAFFFFAPMVNYLFIYVACTLPSSDRRIWAEQERERKKISLNDGIIAGTLAAVATLVLVAVMVFVFQTYSSALFVGVPVMYGFALTAIVNGKERRSFGQSLGLLLLSESLAGGLMIVLALEGALCVLMAAPIFLALSFIGALAADMLFGRWRPKTTSPSLYSLFLLPLAWQPLVGPLEASEAGRLREVLTTIEIDAPPEKVWPNVVQFSELPPPTELIFKLGIAHPLRAVIEGRGVGAVRYCQFSTGDFVEPITEWDEPRRLSFDVKFQPRPMKEMSPYDQIHAPHLDGFMASEKGQFRLIPLANGRTRLEGRTWYRLAIFPRVYWEAFGDYFIHRIHQRVLSHIALETVKN